MIAITFALPQESAALVPMLHAKQTIEGGALPVLRGNLATDEIMILHTGMGEALCRTRTEKFLEQHHPTVLISSGFAGGLDPKLRIGDIVFATNCSNPDLLEKMRGLRLIEARAFFGTLFTQLQLSETAEEKSALFRKTFALAVDMETATIRALCKKFEVPMLSVRSISDTASQRLPVPLPAWFDEEKQKPRIGGLLGYLATHPGVIGEFARFARGTFHARRTLADCLALTIEALEMSSQL